MLRGKSSVGVAFLIIGLMLSQPRNVLARDILLIDDFSGGFGATAGVLSSAGHTVTELTDEVAGGYSRVSDTAFLSNYDMVIYAARDYDAPPAVANAAMESYIRNGGDLLITGFQDNISLPDRSAPDLLRAIGPEYSLGSSEVDHVVSGVDNYITNGPHGDFRNATITNSSGFDQLFANTGLGTIPLVQAAGGQPDKIIFTDLPGGGGSIGAWQGGSRIETNVAQPEFFDGGTFQGMLLNWAEGGTTSQTEVTPRVFSTAAHPLQSTLAVDLYLGDPNDGGSFAASVGPITIEGTMDIVAAINGSGDGTFAVTNTSLTANGVTNLPVDFGLLGTAEFDVNSIEIYLANQIANVVANSIDLTTSPYYVAGLTQSDMMLHSPTGGLEVFLEDIVPLEFSVDRLFYGGPSDFTNPILDGTFDEGIGLFTDLPEFNLVYDNAALDLFYVEGLGTIYGVINGEFHVAYVPEPSGFALATMAVLGGLAFIRRRNKASRG